jgi:mRNA interferase MazF
MPTSPRNPPEPRRGELWLADVDKRRPVVVLTRDPMGRYLSALICAPITSTVRGVTTEVPVGPPDGVRIESVVNLDNTQLVARSRFVRRVGHLPGPTMAGICRALAAATACDGLAQ